MNSFVVRIYREGAGNPRDFVGVVEKPGNPERLAFTSYEELWAILQSPTGPASGKKRKPRGKIAGPESAPP